jgi:hypothetical protein
MAELHNLDPNRPNLCSALRSKDMFIWVEPDADAQRSHSASSGAFTPKARWGRMESWLNRATAIRVSAVAIVTKAM